MKIGLLSDTHGKVATARAAVELLGRHGADYYIHCGDIGATGVLDALAGLPSAVVFGNTDHDRLMLARYATDLGIATGEPFADLTLAGRRLAVTHGDDSALVHRLIEAQVHDYLFTGHTHVPADRRIGRTRCINPGALHRATVRTVALLDLSTDSLELLTVAQSEG